MRHLYLALLVISALGLAAVAGLAIHSRGFVDYLFYEGTTERYSLVSYRRHFLFREEVSNFDRRGFILHSQHDRPAYSSQFDRATFHRFGLVYGDETVFGKGVCFVGLSDLYPLAFFAAAASWAWRRWKRTRAVPPSFPVEAERPAPAKVC